VSVWEWLGPNGREELYRRRRLEILPCSDGFAYTAPVGSFLPNAFSLYDMHGNAFEWVEDCWNTNYRDAPSDGAASLMGDCGRRVRRGGAWNYVASRLRSAFRSSRQGFGRYSNTGLRVARILNR
jgi:sulfatase modifying factor 1